MRNSPVDFARTLLAIVAGPTSYTGFYKPKRKTNNNGIKTLAQICEEARSRAAQEKEQKGGESIPLNQSS